ncbi:hypothetical protein [Pengzhenrongella frigida]|uniref:Uncharacterized protein n=1 Tax=Pengzhenrongella frigida TaxID=1259133 RepID=A0A4Q5MXC5_9MICO|nr:hypothetical protein [Cellulomonas sp. HLT2-17]RYV50392.1 hypothetical protein EUA98_13970 [Cellulomonas sp. HLT2-17]
MPRNDVPPDPATPTDAPGPGRRKRRRVVRPGVGDATPGQSTDDTDVGWHESSGDSSNDDRLRRDVPPHW